MSTRCQIAIEEEPGKLYTCKIYKHCDGYPSGVLPELREFAQAFDKNRGPGPECFIAQCIGFFGRKDPKYGPGSPDHYTGWGVSTFWHADIEYLYVVKGPAVRVYAPPLGDWPNDLEAIPTGFRDITDKAEADLDQLRSLNKHSTDRNGRTI